MRNCSIAVSIILLSWTVVCPAVTPQFWEHFTQEELLEGNLRQASLSHDGKLFPAPSFDLVFETRQSYVFSLVRDVSGNLYAGTGDEGKVYKIDPQGKGTLYFQAKELNVFAMALDASGVLYVGTSPDGKVYKVSGAEQSEVFCDLESKYIWAMLFDTAGNLYVGTGTNGIIYKIGKDGKKAPFYTCSDAHVRTLLWNKNNLLAGTAPNGMILEITPEGKGFAIIDTPLEEVHALALDRSGAIYAAASSAKGSGKAAVKSPAAAGGKTADAVVVTTSITVDGTTGKATETKSAASADDKTSVSTASAIYVIAKDGNVETVYESGAQRVYDLLVREDGTVLLATGPKGRLLELGIDRKVKLITDSPEEDSTRLLAAGDSVWVGSGNHGNIYRLQAKPAPSGNYESKALDAQIVSSWGKIFWKTTGPGDPVVEISTRTGNTEKADNSWSAWSAPYKASGQSVSSPRARYLQWRAVFKQDDKKASAGVLDQVQIAYLQQNVRPQVTDLDVLPYGIELQKQPSLAMSGGLNVTSSTTVSGRSLNSPRERGRDLEPMPPKQLLQPGAQSFTWKAVDDNDDLLEYSLYFKGEKDIDWKLLDRKLSDTFYTLNAASLPDGVYRLKVVVNDGLSNPSETFLIGEKISDPFVITNSPPRVDIGNFQAVGRKASVPFRAFTETGSIASAEFSIDGGDWQLLFPKDGIADSADEDYSVLTPDLAPGEHMIGIRASDRNGTTGTAKLLVRIP